MIAANGLDPTLERAKALISVGRVDYAARLLSEHLARHPSSSNGWLEMALCHLDKGETSSALNAAREAVRLQPEWARGYLMLSHALRSLGRRSEAVEAARECVRLAPDRPAPHVTLGKLLRDVPGATDESLAELWHAIRLAPDDAGAYWALGLTYQRAGRIREAAWAMWEVLRLDPERTDAQAKLARLKPRLEKVKLTELITMQTRVVAASPQDGGSLRYLETLLYQLLRRTRWIALSLLWLVFSLSGAFQSEGEATTQFPAPLAARVFGLFVIMVVCAVCGWFTYRRTPASVWRHIRLLCWRSRAVALTPATALWCLLCQVAMLVPPWSTGGVLEVLTHLAWVPLMLALLWDCWSRRQQIGRTLRRRLSRLLRWPRSLWRRVRLSRGWRTARRRAHGDQEQA